MELTFTEQELAALDVTQITAEVADQSQIGPVIGPLFGRLDSAARAQGVDPEPGLAWYDLGDEGIRLGACVTASLGGDGFEHSRLAAVPRAVVTTYTGPLSRIAEAWQSMGSHLAAAGLQPAGVCREVYHASPEVGDWVIELQQPVA